MSVRTGHGQVARSAYSQIVAGHSGKCLEASGGTAVAQSSCSSQPAQQWTVQPFSPGFRVIARSSGLCLMASGGNVTQNTCSGGANELWSLTALGDAHRIAGQQNGLCLAVAGASLANSAALTQTACSAAPEQQWTFSGGLTTGPATSSLVARHSGQCLQVPGANVSGGAVVAQDSCTGATNEQWTLQPSGNYFQVIAKHSSQCLNVAGASSASGAAVVQNVCSSSESQLWTLRAGAGGYELLAKHSGLCLTVPSSTLTGGATLTQSACAGSLNQSWAVTLPSLPSLWSAKLTMPLVAVAASHLPNGKILTWSSDGEFSFSSDSGMAPSQTYSATFDPATNSFAENLVSSTGHNMFCPGTSTLADGRLMVSGGGSSPKTSFYSADTNTWTTGPLMNVPRGYQSNVVLGDGSVLTVGGSWSGGQIGKAPEVWSPQTNAWRKLDTVNPYDLMYNDQEGYFRADNHAWLISAAGGRVFQAGPSTQMHWIDTAGSGTLTSAGTRGDDVDSVNGKIALFDTGRILKAGGAPGYNAAIFDTRATANTYVIDINNGVNVRKTAPMAYARAFANGVLLPNGQVLMIGGQSRPVPFSDDSALLVPEIWDPATEIFTRLAPMQTPRTYHAVAILMQDGRVFVAGGGLCGACTVNHGDAEILTPPYLLKADGSPAPRPAIVSAPGSTIYGHGNGGPLQVTTDGPVTSFSLIRISSVTHSVNNDERRVPLTIESTPAVNTYRLSLPDDPNLAPPGYYMLFAMNAAGTPSVGRTILVTLSSTAPAVTVNLTAPASNATYSEPATVGLQATATTTGGTITAVEFYNGGTLLGTSSNAPYSFNWTSVAAGTYTLTARAYVDTGSVSTSFWTSSAPVVITVNTSAAVTVAMTSPADGSVLAAPAAFRLAAAASATSGSIVKVEFYDDATLIATVTSAPYVFDWSGVPAGNHTVTAKAYTTTGAQRVSAPVSVIVSTINITAAVTSPASGATFTAPANISLAASATVSGGSVARVEFYNGSVLLGTATSEPYIFNWSGVGAGTYSITAVSYGTFQVKATSAPVLITVTSPAGPSVTLTSPASGATYTAPALVNLTASASVTTGSVTKVEFYNGASLLGTATSAPYSFAWSNVPAGSYTVTAKAYGSNGLSTVSSPAAITVNAPATVTVALTSPTAGASFTSPATVSLAATASTTSGSITKVEFYNGAVLLGSAASAPYTFAWPSVAAGSYSLTAKAYGSTGVTSTSSPVSITVTAPASVTVALTSPASGATFTAPASVSLAATASTTSGSITKVEFYNGATLLGTAAASPYTLAWSNVAAGTYTITAKAYGSTGVTSTSSPVTITVNAPASVSVSLTSPANGATFVSPATVSLAATASASSGSITKVEFYSGSTLLGTDAAAPYTFVWSGVGAGTYVLTAKAYGSTGVTAVSASATINVTVPVAVTVALTSPANNAVFTAPASVSLAATASTNSGSITKVEFYNGASLLGTSTASPYTFTWSSVAAGSYSITAKAYGSTGVTATSAASSIAVNSAAAVITVALTSPANGSSFTVPATVNLAATASTTSGTITKVEFYAGATLVGTDTTAPYSFAWSGATAGSYSLTAKAYTATGSATSAAVNISVSAGGAVSPAPVGRWNMDTVTNNVTNDSTAAANHATISGGYTAAAGKYGQAIAFNEVTGGAVTKRAPFDPTRSFSVATWVYMPYVGGTQTFVSQPAGQVSNFYLQLGGWALGTFVFDLYQSDSTGSSDFYAVGATKPVVNTWYHIVGVYDAAAQKVKIYVNGRLDGQANASSGSFANAGPLAFGYSKWAGARADGTDARIDDVRAYSVALTDADVANLYAGR